MNTTACRSIAAILTLFVLTSCGTTQTTEKKEASKSQADAEYSYTPATGSRIPVKRKKADTKTEKTDERSLEDMQRQQTMRNMRRDGS